MTRPATASLARTGQLLGHLSAREFRLRYSSALLGWVWAVLPPLVRLAVLGLVFTTVLPVDTDNYLAVLAVGLVAWTWFSSGISNATRSAVDRRELLGQPGLPREVIPLVSVLTDAFDYLAALPILLVIVVLVTGSLPATAVLLPVVLVLQGLLIVGLGMAASVADVRFRDARLGVDLLLAVGFYATPVFYSLDAVPERVRDGLALNPMAQLIEAQRDLLIEGRLPPLGPTVAVSVVAIAVAVGGWALHRRSSPSFLDHL